MSPKCDGRTTGVNRRPKEIAGKTATAAIVGHLSYSIRRIVKKNLSVEVGITPGEVVIRLKRDSCSVAADRGEIV